MNRLIVFAILILMCGGFCHADIKPLQVAYLSLSFADFTTTTIGVKNGYMEINPVARWYVYRPALSLCVQAISAGMVTWATSTLYKKNKTLGIILTSVLVMVKGYVVFHNIKELI